MDEAAEADPQRQAEDTEDRAESVGEKARRADPRDGRHHRAPKRAFREQRLAEHLGEGRGGQAEAEAHQHEGGAGHIRIVEGAAPEQHRGDGIGEAPQRDGRGHSEQQSEADRPVLRRRGAAAARRSGSAPRVPAAGRCSPAPPSARGAVAPPGRRNRATTRPRARMRPPAFRPARKAAPPRSPRAPENRPATGFSKPATRPACRSAPARPLGWRARR